MKRFALSVLFIAGGFFIQAEEKPGFYLESLNLAIPFKVPVSHYRVFSEYEVGFGIQTNFGIGGSNGFRIFMGADGTYNVNSSPRIEHLVDANINLGLGWEFNPGKRDSPLLPSCRLELCFTYSMEILCSMTI